MSSPAPLNFASHRVRCYVCFRPEIHCFCDAIPTVHNKTEVLILQHPHERFHAFNTARIVGRALQRSRIIVGYGHELDATTLPIRGQAGVLYPGRGAIPLEELPPGERPEQLVVLDGTWRQSRSLMREITDLHTLPRYELNPTAPSRYRIRREPSDLCLSTLEATVEILRTIEPETSGLEALLRAFDRMVDDQLARSVEKVGKRQRSPRRKISRKIPPELVTNLENIVVGYGESSHGEGGRKPSARSPVFWVAQRLKGGDPFRCAIRTDTELPPRFLDHLELTRDDFENAVSLDEFRQAWKRFLRPDDILAVYYKSNLRLLRNIQADFSPGVLLKAVYSDLDRRHDSLHELVETEGIQTGPQRQPGRAGRRLAQSLAAAEQLSRWKSLLP